ncbi:glycoside hydrolase family 18 protein [Amycolatopsis sp., V23-08]|uniref:chitinase n=1 Tax=Amycolatopsis heterodermiae TaxID=3110235 RepID=A0ABU5QVI5_9PSEU|nr:glycoside hydrolase family 18 protein [Amycolatopsis sp., V23-08]MEA5357930.1 glycoside hydrolase family 18 protein [Amycolatopsis sp., V23-08]
MLRMRKRFAVAALALAAAAVVAPPAEAGQSHGGPSQDKVMAYFADWDVYARNYHVKDIETSGSAAKLTHINYAFGNVTGGGCAVGDPWADHDMPYDAAGSVNGQADSGTLHGSFNQLLELKKLHPKLKVLWSFGGWTWSSGFTEAAKNPAAFAESCYNLVNDPRWAGVFDGIDIDWEYPNACGLTCDTSGPKAFTGLVKALRAKFGHQLVTAAITADGSKNGKIDANDYAGASRYLDWYNVMTYDYFVAGASPTGPTAPHSPLRSYPGIPTAGFYADAAIQKLRHQGVPSSKMLLGLGFYGRGWDGVTQKQPGGTATGPVTGTTTGEDGVENYKVLKTTCPANGKVAGTAYAKCGSQWWSYDTPETAAAKAGYAKSQGLGGVFAWELSGDTTNAELLRAISSGRC